MKIPAREPRSESSASAQTTTRTAILRPAVGLLIAVGALSCQDEAPVLPDEPQVYNPQPAASSGAVLAAITPTETQTSDSKPPPSEQGCVTAGDCAYAIVPQVASADDCACPRCPSDSEPITRSELAQRKASFGRICREWLKENACAPRFCAAPRQLACGDTASCSFAN